MGRLRWAAMTLWSTWRKTCDQENLLASGRNQNILSFSQINLYASINLKSFHPVPNESVKHSSQATAKNRVVIFLFSVCVLCKIPGNGCDAKQADPEVGRVVGRAAAPRGPEGARGVHQAAEDQLAGHVGKQADEHLLGGVFMQNKSSEISSPGFPFPEPCPPHQHNVCGPTGFQP